MVLTESLQKLKVGDKMPEFTLSGVDGKLHRSFDYDNANAIVVIFMCNHCPYVLAKLEAIKELHARYRPKNVAIIGINSNNHPDFAEDDFEHMKAFAKERGIAFPYLFDDTQKVAKAFGAVCTPDPFLFDGSGRLVYHGRIDDAMSPESAPTKHDMADALDMVLEGRQPKVGFTPSRGCSIKWKE